MRSVCGPPGTQRYLWPCPLNIRYQLREDAVNRVGMHERDLEPEEALPRLVVDQLDTLFGELVDRGANVRDLVSDMVHPGPPFGEELADRSLIAERGQQLDATRADRQGGRFDALCWNRLAMLEARPEDPLIGRHRFVEVLDRNA